MFEVKRKYRNLFEITPKESLIIKTICEDGIFTKKKLAEHFFLSEYTISTHLNNIYEKLNVHTMAELVYVYYTKGLKNEIQLHTRKE